MDSTDILASHGIGTVRSVLLHRPQTYLQARRERTPPSGKRAESYWCTSAYYLYFYVRDRLSTENLFTACSETLRMNIYVVRATYKTHRSQAREDTCPACIQRLGESKEAW